MARARNIKPGFFANEKLAECDPLARLLFAGLWCLADREGRLEDRPKRIRAEVLPYDVCDAEALLEQLKEHGFILRYESCGSRYIQVLNFDKHQNPHMKEAKSSFPAPDGFGAHADAAANGSEKAPDKHCASTSQVNAQNQKSPADPGFLIPDSLIPDSLKEPAKPSRPSAGLKTLKAYLAECEELGVKPVPDEHSIRKFMVNAGICDEMQQLAWMRFREEHTIGTRKDKRQKDWPATFANSVKDRWYRLWFIQADGPAQWTTEGLQAKRVADAASEDQQEAV